MSGAGSKGGGQVLRALNMLDHLAGHAPEGLSNKDLAAALRCPPPYVTRTAESLIQKGWVEKDAETGRFRITTRFGRLTFKVRDGFTRAREGLEQLERNYTLNS